MSTLRIKLKLCILFSIFSLSLSFLVDGTAFSQTIKLVRNEGANPLKQFTVSSGRQSNPVLVDIDGDGDIDCFSGEFNWNKTGIVNSHISFYKNTGDARHPVFTEMKGAKNPLAAIAIPGLLIPRFADIDGDGDLDCFIASNTGSILFYENKGTANAASFVKQSAAFNPLSNVKFSGIAISQFLLEDVDIDGDLDCLITDEDGNEIYYQNQGTASNAQFVMTDKASNPFALIDSKAVNNISFCKLSKTGINGMFVNAGYYENNYGHFSKSSIAPVIENNDAISSNWVDLNSDGSAEIVSGTADGKFVYNTPDNAGTNAILTLTASPNPSTKNFTVYLPSSTEKRTLQVLNESGKIISVQTISSNHCTFGDSFASGVYFIQIYSEGKKIAEQKIVKL